MPTPRSLTPADIAGIVIGSLGLVSVVTCCGWSWFRNWHQRKGLQSAEAGHPGKQVCAWHQRKGLQSAEAGHPGQVLDSEAKKQMFAATDNAAGAAKTCGCTGLMAQLCGGLVMFFTMIVVSLWRSAGWFLTVLQANAAEPFGNLVWTVIGSHPETQEALRGLMKPRVKEQYYQILSAIILVSGLLTTSTYQVVYTQYVSPSPNSPIVLLVNNSSGGNMTMTYSQPAAPMSPVAQIFSFSDSTEVFRVANTVSFLSSLGAILCCTFVLLTLQTYVVAPGSNLVAKDSALALVYLCYKLGTASFYLSLVCCLFSVIMAAFTFFGTAWSKVTILSGVLVLGLVLLMSSVVVGAANRGVVKQDPYNKQQVSKQELKSRAEEMSEAAGKLRKIDPEIAEGLCRRALAIREQLIKPTDSTYYLVAESKLHLAEVVTPSAEAGSLCKHALPVIRSRYGPDSLEEARCLKLLATNSKGATAEGLLKQYQCIKLYPTGLVDFEEWPPMTDEPHVAGASAAAATTSSEAGATSPEATTSGAKQPAKATGAALPDLAATAPDAEPSAKAATTALAEILANTPPTDSITIDIVQAAPDGTGSGAGQQQPLRRPHKPSGAQCHHQ